MSVISLSEGIRFDQPWGRLTWLASREIGNSSTMTFGRVEADYLKVFSRLFRPVS
jgi:hypothetical protein